MKFPALLAGLITIFPLRLPAMPPLKEAHATANPMAALASAAIRGDATAIAKLRVAGPAGLEAVLKAGAPEIASLQHNRTRLESPEHEKLRAALDGVARQRDAWASGLYWFTDLNAALSEAKRTGKPILSLRLLGNLDDEYSCANSRFFRTYLYPNRAVSDLLRKGFVLHWKSVRPVPVLTIDMGDGRRIRRTITGNSIHYVLNSEGRVLDALPGNYGPAAFLAALHRIESGALHATPDQARAWHGSESNLLCREWLADAVRCGVFGDKASAAMEDPTQAAKLLSALFPDAFPASSGKPSVFTVQQATAWLAHLNAAPSSASPVVSRFGAELNDSILIDDLLARAAERTSSNLPALPLPDSMLVRELFPRLPNPRIEIIKEFPYPTEFDPPATEFDPPKGMIERPILKKAPAPSAEAALDLAKPSAGTSASMADRMTNALWAKIGQRHRSSVRIDRNGQTMMLAKLPAEIATPEQSQQTILPGNDSPFSRMLENFESAISRDMVRNEYYFHTLIHQWLEEDRDSKLADDVEALNKRVYAELFLTPDYDEWLGLVPEDTYTALEKDGCACDKGAPPMHSVKQSAPPEKR